MPKYEVKVMVEFQGEIYADSEQEANDIAYSGWSEKAGADISYYGVYSTSAEEIDDEDDSEYDEEEEEEDE